MIDIPTLPRPPLSMGAPLVSVLTLALAALALAAAFGMYLHDGGSVPLVGAISMCMLKAGTVVDFWLGSSSGSQKKDVTIAGQIEAPKP